MPQWPTLYPNKPQILLQKTLNIPTTNGVRLQFQYIFSIYYQPPMILRRQFQYIFLISYQPPMVLRRQFQCFYAAKSNTPDQEQATIKQTNA